MRDQQLSAYHVACNDLENAKHILSKHQVISGDDEVKLRAVSNDVVTVTIYQINFNFESGY